MKTTPFEMNEFKNKEARKIKTGTTSILYSTNLSGSTDSASMTGGDGWSGKKFDCPHFQRMIADIEAKAHKTDTKSRTALFTIAGTQCIPPRLT